MEKQIMGILLAFIYINFIGYQIINDGKLNLLWCAILLFGCILIYFVLRKLPITNLKINNPIKLEKSNKNHFVIVFLILLIIYLVMSLIFFPGIYAYDTTSLLSEWKRGYLYSNQPAIYTLFVGVVLEIGYFLFNSYQIAGYIVTLVQIVIFALCNAYAISFIFNNFKVNIFIKIVVLFLFGLMPYNSILAVSITKDVIFSGLFVVLIVIMLKIIYFEENKNSLYIGLGIISIILMLLRKNMVIVSLLFLVLIIICKNKNKIMLIKTLIISLIITISLSTCVDSLFRKSDYSLYETLSIPLSQLAKISIDYYDDFSNYDKAMVYKLWGIDEDYRNYSPYLSDKIKLPNFDYLLSDSDNFNEFLQWWLKMGIKYPKSYIESFLSQNIGSWYIFDKTHSEIYDIKYYDGKPITEFNGVYGYLQTFCFETDYPIYEDSLMPMVRDTLVKFVSNNQYQDIPMLWILFSPALYFWVLVFNMYFKRHDNKTILIMSFMLITWVSYLFGPCTLVRYMLPIMNGTIIITLFNLGISKEKVIVYN